MVLLLKYTCHSLKTLQVYFVCFFQGSVTEDKASSSYVVVPIPTSLEEGRPSSIELIYLIY